MLGKSDIETRKQGICRLGCVVIVTIAMIGCGDKKPAPGPVAGTLNMEGLSIDQQIEKVKNDPSIPEQYKQTYLRSLEDKKKAGVSN